jgi:hypothetical protein
MLVERNVIVHDVRIHRGRDFLAVRCPTI